MRGRLRVLCAAALVLALTSCSTEGSLMSHTRDYSSAIATAEQHLSDVRSRVPAGLVERDETIVTDLDRDAHRLTCSETMSLYTNAINVWLTAEGDSAGQVEALRDSLMAEGWTRTDSIEEELTGEQDRDGIYQQLLANPEGYEITLSRWSTPQAGEGLQIDVRSPCVPNPSDKPDYWGK